jgi:hypothetical protein
MESSWVVEIANEFAPEFHELDEHVQTEILALSRVLQQFGPQLGRPRVDTLKGSRHANMKELRFNAVNGAWHSLLIRRAGRFCSWLGTNRARVNDASIASCSRKPMAASTLTWPD